MKAYKLILGRIYFIDKKLRSRAYPNCHTMAKEYEASARTFQRDIDYMRTFMDAPIEFDRKRNGYYYTDEAFFLPAMSISEREALLFIINSRILSQYQETPYYQELKKVIDKILKFIPDDLDIEHKGDFISFQQPPLIAIQRENFDILESAIVQERQLNITYYTQYRNEVTQRTVDPYKIYNHQGNWYLLAHCHVRDEVRMFAMNRILTIETTDNYFQRPENFSTEELLKNSFNIICGGETYHVVLKFSPYQSRWIRERQWHRSQKLTELDDGGVMLGMEVQGLDEVKRWVMQYGGEVEVVEPEVLREDVLREIGKMAELYSRGNSR